MAVGRRKAERAQVPRGDVLFAILVLRVVGLANERGVAQLRRQQMAAQNPFGVPEVFRVPPLPQNQRRLDDVARVVDLATVRVDAVGAAFDDPADLVADLV